MFFTFVGIKNFMPPHPIVKRFFIFFALFLASLSIAKGQKVGVVLSGGGASALTHVGVLKSLEENNIPIDYITGTSMGALIGGLYASGYSPNEIDSLVQSRQFRNMARGNIPEKYTFFFKKEEKDASWINLKFFKDSVIQTSLPTNLIKPVMMDLELMEIFSGPSAVSRNNFDSLFIPFRCVASDITSKKEVVFREGPLNKAIRASMSYPFYLKPISVNGKLLFDGGLYNNFPSDIMYENFFPDIIIGSNVSSNVPSPQEDNIVTQVKNMMIDRKDYSKVCENGIIIEPNTDISTFEFSNIDKAIKDGYHAASERMDEIKSAIDRRVDPDSLNKKREAFIGQSPKLVFDNLKIKGLNEVRSNYVKRSLRIREDTISMDRLRPKYFHVYTDPKIKSIFPNAIYNPNTVLFDLELEVKREKDIITQFGGNFSSRPVNTGFIGVKYNYLGKVSLSLGASAHFGRFYTSASANSRLDFPLFLPFYIEPLVSINRWDYFKSSAAFFENLKPPFLVQNDRFGGLRLGMPAGTKGLIKGDFKYSMLKNEYYQKEDFSASDTVDQTTFESLTAGLEYERSSLNRKQFPSKGSYLRLSARYVDGIEHTIPGSTSPFKPDTFEANHKWVQFKLKYENYFIRRGDFRMGFSTEAVYSTQPFFNNYKGTILSAPAFQPIPESKTLFLESFRAYKYITFGLKNIFKIRNNLDFRMEGYIFQPLNSINNDQQKPKFGKEFETREFLGSGSFVYHSPLGPISFSLNYYDGEEEFSFLFNFGYLIHNRGSLE